MTVIHQTTKNENITFNEATNDLVLNVTDQSTGISTLIVPDFAGNTETIAVLSDLTSGFSIDGNGILTYHYPKTPGRLPDG